MKINQIAFGQAIRFMKIAPSTGQTIYGKKLASAFEEKYGFLEGPKLVSDFDTGKGVTFLHGFFENTTVIEKAVIYNDGMIVESKADTDLCDQFIDDAVKWASENANIHFGLDDAHPRLYLSHVVVEDNIGIAKLFSRLSSVGVELSKILESYGDVNRDIELIGFAMQSDVTERAGPVPFKFERRAGVPFSSNLYFSSAPVRTSDHVNLLHKLESILSD
jgi:hypothetical protein